MADTENKQQGIRTSLPEGRLINHSFFNKDIFDEGGKREGVPSYKFEVVIDPDAVLGAGKFEDQVIEAACAEWGDKAEDWVLDGKVKWFKEGNEYAKEREDRQKPGDAYKDKLIFRGHTIYNKFGEDAPGGIRVYDADVKEIEPVNQGEIYRGCYGIVGVKLNAYQNSEGKYCVSYYLLAFQKTKDGERLAGSGDHSDLFKPVGRKEGEAPARRSRKG